MCVCVFFFWLLPPAGIESTCTCTVLDLCCYVVGRSSNVAKSINLYIKLYEMLFSEPLFFNYLLSSVFEFAPTTFASHLLQALELSVNTCFGVA